MDSRALCGASGEHNIGVIPNAEEHLTSDNATTRGISANVVGGRALILCIPPDPSDPLLATGDGGGTRAAEMLARCSKADADMLRSCLQELEIYGSDS